MFSFVFRFAARVNWCVCDLAYTQQFLVDWKQMQVLDILSTGHFASADVALSCWRSRQCDAPHLGHSDTSARGGSDCKLAYCKGVKPREFRRTGAQLNNVSVPFVFNCLSCYS